VKTRPMLHASTVPCSNSASATMSKCGWARAQAETDVRLLCTGQLASVSRFHLFMLPMAQSSRTERARGDVHLP
jgi:hypothetical protein